MKPSILTKPGPLVMGILNVTPDSFSDGGQFSHKNNAFEHAQRMLEEGADIIDIGGESTRPGAQAVSVQQEIRRVIPLVEALQPLGVSISVDTSKTEVMSAAIDAGATMINDVRALQADGALEVIVDGQVDVCLMHMQGEPRTMQDAPYYINVVKQVGDFLRERVNACVEAGIDKRRICLDPGIGFGKTLQHNCQLLKHLYDLQIGDLPLLVGVSRKRMFEQILGLEVDKRMVASVAAGLIAVTKGAKILRVHDVKATKEAIEVYKAIEQH
ncbi:MAG: dihydropteroate synthase [Gammaproteobacteria bacterium]|nr:dihydropteroate synthase [Gammaproteobacteria bacterium]